MEQRDDTRLIYKQNRKENEFPTKIRRKKHFKSVMVNWIQRKEDTSSKEDETNKRNNDVILWANQNVKLLLGERNYSKRDKIWCGVMR